MIDDVIARLKERVTDLRRVEGAAGFTAIMERRAWPENTPAAYVIPVSLAGGTATGGANSYVQATVETIGVVLILRPNDRLGTRGIEPVEGLKADVIAALAGWAPGDQTGDFTLKGGRMTNVQAGACAYQIDFAISDQLRILS
ncbi:hypothetical protein [uncultured Sulfitobacter sp.]|uniref:phage tail terminator protein n=1 Tax=uncultured Sulfitobacter sp. TaxID=191468 RepID=UPI0030D804C4